MSEAVPIVIEAGGCRIVVSGDYKREADPTCRPFEAKITSFHPKMTDRHCFASARASRW